MQTVQNHNFKKYAFTGVPTKTVRLRVPSHIYDYAVMQVAISKLPKGQKPNIPSVLFALYQKGYNAGKKIITKSTILAIEHGDTKSNVIFKYSKNHDEKVTKVKQAARQIEGNTMRTKEDIILTCIEQGYFKVTS